MPREYKNLVSDTTTTVGLGNFVLTGAIGFPGTQTFAAHTDGVEVGYHVFSAGNVEFEAGRGIWDAVNSTLTRVSVETSSNANAKVSFSAGVKTVISTPVASDMVVFTNNVGGIGVGSTLIGANSLALGSNASANASQALAIGANAYAATEGVAIGRATYAEASSTTVGKQAGGYTGANQIDIGYKAGWNEDETGALHIDAFSRSSKTVGRASAILYGVMKSTANVSQQTLTTNSAFTARFGMNIPLGQTYKIDGVAIGGSGDALVANTLDQFADVTQTATKTLAITESTTLNGGTHSGNNSGDQDLTGLVPYTGATANVDLGANNLSSAGVTVGGIVIFAPNAYIQFIDPLKQGYIWIGNASYRYDFEGGGAEGGLDFSAVTGGDKNFTFPNQSGTVALTSDITGTNSGTNTGDQPSIVGITGTIAEFNDALTDVNMSFATLDGGGKIPAAQLPSTLMEYHGNWDASLNNVVATSLPIANGVGSAGDVYRVSVAGTPDLGAGPLTFEVGDWVVYNGNIWEESPNSDEVVSVNGQTGIVIVAGITGGIATLNFGSGNKMAEIVVTGVTQVAALSNIFCDMRVEATLAGLGHSVDDMLIDPIRLLIHTLVAGVGFTIYGEMPDGKGNGTYNINWILR